MVLVVDDIELNRVLLCELLKRVNLDTITAQDGQEGVLLAEKINPDLIIMDIRMSVMDGFEANQILKSDPKTRQIPVIALTASTADKDRTFFLKKGFAGYIAKPLQQDILLTEISNFLKPVASEIEFQEDGKRLSDLNMNEIKQPAELVSKLEKEISPFFLVQEEVMVMNEIKQFCQKLHDVGEEHNLSVFMNYARELKDDVSAFDISAIEATFQKLPEVVKNLIDMLEKANDR